MSKKTSSLARRTSVLTRTTLGSITRRLPRHLVNYAGVMGLLILTGLILMALFPRVVAPHDPRELVGRPLERPNAQFVLGTNDIGQDLMSELIWGTRVSLSTGLIVAILAIAVGTVVGLVSGYTSGIFSTLLMRLVDLTLVMPFLPLVILLSAYLGPSQRNVIIVLTVVSWAAPARLIRSRALSLMNETYIEAARAVGCSGLRIIRRHIWPGVRPIAMVQLLLVASSSILAEASLSFLGLGDPATKSWGTSLYFARASGVFLGDAWRWWVLPTGLLITLTVLSLALIAYALEQRFEPSLRARSGPA